MIVYEESTPKYDTMKSKHEPHENFVLICAARDHRGNLSWSCFDD